jgi:hypothetical protein
MAQHSLSGTVWSSHHWPIRDTSDLNANRSLAPGFEYHYLASLPLLQLVLSGRIVSKNKVCNLSQAI